MLLSVLISELLDLYHRHGDGKVYCAHVEEVFEPHFVEQEAWPLVEVPRIQLS